VDADLLATFADIQWTHWWFRGRRAVLDDVLARRLGGPPSRRNLEVQRVLEVGCGTGAMVPVLAKYGAVTGMDPSGEAVAECKAQFPEHTLSPTTCRTRRSTSSPPSTCSSTSTTTSVPCDGSATLWRPAVCSC
jgi:SAM-dependent methyltransferase